MLEQARSRLGRAGCGEGLARQLEALREQTLATVGGWGARELANLAHALGKLEAVARASLRQCAAFKPQELANTAWGFAKAGPAASALLKTIAAVAATCLL